MLDGGWIVMIWALARKAYLGKSMSLDGHFPNFKHFKFVKRLTFPLQENLGEVGPSKTMDSDLSWGERAVFSPQKSNELIIKLPYVFFSSPLFQTISVISFRGWTKLPMATLCLRCFFYPIRVSYGDKLMWSPFPASQGWFGECMWSPSLQLIILSHHTLKGAKKRDRTPSVTVPNVSKCHVRNKNSNHNPTISEEMGTKSALLLNPFQNGCVVTHGFKHKIVWCLRKHSWHLPPIRNPAIWDSCDACASEILRQQRGATTDNGLRPCEYVHWFLCRFLQEIVEIIKWMNKVSDVICLWKKHFDLNL